MPHKMAEVMTVSNYFRCDAPFAGCDEDMPLVGCEICLYETANIIDFQYNHRCCNECVRKIDNCHICGCELRKSEIFKTCLELTLLKSTVVRIPLYYNILNLKIDNILMRLCIHQTDNILTDNGYKTYASLEQDTCVEPLRVNTGLTNEDSIIMIVRKLPNLPDATDNCLNDNLSPMILMFLVSQHIQQADTSDVKLLTGTYTNDKKQYSRKVNGKFKYSPENKDMVDYVTVSQGPAFE